MHKDLKKGFTLVELLIVIVVIAILASITLVTYNGIQARARDSVRISDMNALTKGMTLWSTETGKLPTESGAGRLGAGTGWVHAYENDIDDMLIASGYLSEGVGDPVYKKGSGSYMFYACGSPDTSLYAFFAHMDNPANAPNNGITRWRDLGCNSGPLQVNYMMNYARTFSL